jgi:hypothetical protein
MKRTFKVLGIIGLMLVIGFSFVACGGDDDSGSGGSGGGGGGGSGGISGGTVTYPDGIANADKPTDFSFVPNSLTVNYPLSSRINEPASVTISCGKLSIKLGIPLDRYLISTARFFDDDVTVTPSGVKLSPLDGSFCTVDQEYYLLCIKGNSYAGLFYVDNDVTIKGTHTDKDTFIYDVSLKEGWNYYYAESYDNATRTTKWASSVSLPNGYIWTVMDKNTFKQFYD